MNKYIPTQNKTKYEIYAQGIFCTQSGKKIKLLLFESNQVGKYYLDGVLCGVLC